MSVTLPSPSPLGRLDLLFPRFLIDTASRSDAPAITYDTPTPESLGLIIPADTDDIRPRVGQPLVVQMDLDQLMHRRRNVLEDTLNKLGLIDCAAILICDCLPEQLKAGRVYQKLAQLKDAGLCDALLMDCPNSLAAEWVVDNTPIHGVVVPAGANDLSARYRLLDLADTSGVAVLARTQDPGLILATAGFHGAIVQSGLGALFVPKVTEDQAQQVWKDYQSAHQPPPKLKGNHPPDFG